ncbi:MAG: hypothetical protein U1C71_01320, partial [archaeon]|nr:hypothetical protein [archaeon]
MSKEIVVPGEMVSEHLKQMGTHVYAFHDRIYSDVLGIKNETEDRISVVPLRGRYLPMSEDVVIGIVRSERFAGYDVDINSFYPTFVSKQDLRDPLKIGGVISAKVVKVNEVNEAEIGMVKSLSPEGDVVSVTPVKVPRIIGKNASMLNVIRNGTGAHIMVGRNGFIFLQGGDIALAKEALLRVETYAHVDHLTQNIQQFLAAKTGTGLPGTQGPLNEASFDVHGYSRPPQRGGFRGGDHRGPPRGDRRSFGSSSFRPRSTPSNYRGND